MEPEVTFGTFGVTADGRELVVAVKNPEDPKVVLYFTTGEWDAFIDGVQKGEFDLPAEATR